MGKELQKRITGCILDRGLKCDSAKDLARGRQIKQVDRMLARNEQMASEAFWNTLERPFGALLILCAFFCEPSQMPLVPECRPPRERRHLHDSGESGSRVGRSLGFLGLDQTSLPLPRV
jgi:hypothetical protein